MKNLLLIFVFLTINFYSCDLLTGDGDFPFRGDWRIVKTEGKNIATIEGTLFTFNEDGTLVAKKGLISNNGNFESIKRGEVTFSYGENKLSNYTFKKINKKSFWLKKIGEDEKFYFEKE